MASRDQTQREYNPRWEGVAKVPPLRNAHKETGKVILMGLRKDRGKRIQTAGRFAELLGQAIGFLRAIKEGRAPETGPGSTPSASQPAGIGGPTTGMNTLPSSAAVPTMPVYGAPPEERTGKTIAIALGLVALALVGLMVFVDFGGGDDDKKDTPAANGDDGDKPSADGDAPPTPKNFPLTRPLVSTNVEGAAVLVDGKEQCKTPCVIEVPVGDDISHEIRITKDGYIDVVQNWRPSNVSEPLPPLPDMKEL